MRPALDLIIGVGEVGRGLLDLFRECGRRVCGYDIDPNRCFGKPENVDLMHICFPFTSRFVDRVMKYFDKWSPKSIVIHSTVKPGTTMQLHNNLLDGNIVYSPVRGVHTRMLIDLKRYTKFYSSYPDSDESLFLECFEDVCRLSVDRFSNPFTLEAAKVLVDSSYYGWIIVFGQLVDKFCMKYGLEYDEVWRFADEIHEFLGNRPKVYIDEEGIGGHCVLQNLDLVEGDLPELKETIIKINKETRRRHKVRGKTCNNALPPHSS